jgi:hypothetical protein
MEIAAFLKKEIVGHFGLPPEEYDFLAMAKRVHTWFETYWSKPGELTTIYVALLDEGVDVWRPVQARMIGSDRYRILGIDADVSDEKWQFPPGAVVRCEPKRFSSGEVGTIAVARVDTAG